MLRSLGLVDQFNELERDLPDDWSEARLELTVADEALAERAAALLGPSNPGRFNRMIRFAVGRRGAGVGPEAARRLLKRLDGEGIRGELRLHGAEKASVQTLPRRESLRAQWGRALSALPPDWSDMYAEVRFDSTDYVERSALLLAPLNPTRCGGVATLCFRCAHHFGYGVSPEMAARCFERCDAGGITGEVEILRSLSDTQPIGTQGPVWLIGGRTV